MKELTGLNLRITHEAAKWYKKELELDSGTHLRFYVRYGFGGYIPGFSLAIDYGNPPYEVHASSDVDGITFFIETKDAWYFDDKDLEVRINQQTQEPEFLHK